MATNKNRFKTIMVEDADRDAFTVIRDNLSEKLGFRVTDKALFAAVFQHTNLENAEADIVATRNEVVAAREAAKIEKLKAKLAELEQG